MGVFLRFVGHPELVGVLLVEDRDETVIGEEGPKGFIKDYV